MPPLRRRRNHAYLNRQFLRFGRLDRGLDNPALMPAIGLAIDLGGSLERRFRPANARVAYLEKLLA
jgi:hypothetical protein